MLSYKKEIQELEGLITKRDPERANRLANHLMKGHSSDTRVLNLTARARLLSDNVEEAKKIAEIACQYSRDPNARYILGFCHHKLGEFEKAAETYRSITQIEPRNAFAHFQLAESLKRSGKPGESLQAYRKAADLDSEGDIRPIAEAEILRLKEFN